jgi:hypothetical protein
MTFDEWWSSYENEIMAGIPQYAINMAREMARDAWNASQHSSDEQRIVCRHCRFTIENSRYGYRHVVSRGIHCPGGHTVAEP